MNPVTLRENDVVALTEDLVATHFLTAAPLLIPRGQMGVVALIYALGDASEVEVEFAEADGETFAMLPIPVTKLLRLSRGAPLPVAA